MTRQIWKYIVSIVFGFAVFGYFQIGPLVMFSNVEIVAGADHSGTIYFQYRYAPSQDDFSRRRTRVIEYDPGSYMRVGASLSNARISHVEMHLSDEGAIDIASIRLVSHFRQHIYIEADNLLEIIEGENVDIEDRGDYLRLTPTASPAIIHLNIEVNAQQSGLSLSVPIIAAGALLLLLLPWNWRDSIIRKDLLLTDNDPRHINALDGLRGVAAVAVVGDHAWGWLSGSGTFGVWIFFALSGFLLLQPFVRRPERGFDGGYFLGYLRRRILRIIPLYYSLLIISYLANRDVDRLFQHMLFIRGDAHLWTLPEEIVFYLCLPIITVLLGIGAMINRTVAFVILVGLWYWLVNHPDVIPIQLYLFGGSFGVHLGWFLGGGVAAFLVYFQGEKQLPTVLQHVLSTIAMLVLIGGIAYSSVLVYELLYGKQLAYAKAVPYPFAYISAFLVWAFAVTPRGVGSRFLSLNLLRWMGLVGFGIYLFHPIIMYSIDAIYAKAMDDGLDGKYRLIATTTVTLWFASMAYKYIERPFLAIARAAPDNGLASGLEKRSSAAQR